MEGRESERVEGREGEEWEIGERVEEDKRLNPSLEGSTNRWDRGDVQVC